MWKSFNFWFGLAIGSAVIWYNKDLELNTLITWCFLSLVNFIFALEQTLSDKKNEEKL